MTAAPESYLYCMATRCGGRLYFKLGRSYAPAARVRQIARGGGAKMPPGWRRQPVELVAVRPGGRAEEDRIHADLHQYRVYRTEWFQGHQAVVDYVLADGAWVPWAGG